MRVWQNVRKSYASLIHALSGYGSLLGTQLRGSSRRIQTLLVLVINLLISILGFYLWRSGFYAGIALTLMLTSVLVGSFIALYWSGAVKELNGAVATLIGVFVALGLGVYSIDQQYRLEVHRIRLSIPDLTIRLDQNPLQNGITVESISGTFRPKLGLVSLDQENLHERPTVGIIVGVKPREGNVPALDLKLFVEISGEYRLYGAVCNNCDEFGDENVRAMVDVAGEIPSRIRIQVLRIDPGTAVAIYPGVASRKDTGGYTLTVWGYTSNNGTLARESFPISYVK